MSEYKVLRDFGFTKSAVVCYENLFKHGGASVPQLAKRLRKPRTGLYRVLRRLETKGFVISEKSEGQPAYFYAEPAETALRKYIDYQWQVAEKLMDEQGATLARRSGKRYRGTGSHRRIIS